MPRTKKRFRKLPVLEEPSQELYSIKLGNFKAAKKRLQEAAINNLVLRIPIEECMKNKEKTKTVQPPKSILTVQPKIVLSPLNLKRIIPSDLKRTTSSNSNRATLSDPRNPSNSFKEMIQASFKNKILNERIENNGFRSKTIRPAADELVQDTPHATRYYLEFLSVSNYLTRRSNRVNVNFTKLQEQVCSMKLPSVRWKVTVMININRKAIFSFSNDSLKKCVSFSESNPSYQIVMDGVPVILLGSPGSVDTVEDIELLLDIVHTLSSTDCMVMKV